MNETIRALIAVAAQLSGYQIPAAELTVVEAPKVVLDAIYCAGRRSCRVAAVYQDQNVIIIRDDLAPDAKDHVLVHEIIHWMQHHSGRFADTCMARYVREREAYSIQNQYIFTVQNGFVFYHPPSHNCGVGQ